MATRPITAGQEWRAYWPLVLAAMVGVSFGSMPTATLGLFIDPLNREFGWSSSEISIGVTIFALISIPMTPLAGALVDRFGGRRVALPGLILSGLAFAAFSLQGGWLAQWMITWVGYTFASLLIRSMVWNRTISGTFSAGRGLAIAVVIAGLSLPQIVAPPLAEWLIREFDWRQAYVALGLGWAGIALILVFLFFRAPEAKPVPPQVAQAATPPPTHGGLSVREAIRNWRIIRITIAIALQGMIGAAIAIHIVPLLTSEGLERASAATIASVLGLSSLAGNLSAGWLADRVKSPVLPLTAFALPALGYFVVVSAGGSFTTLASAFVLIGLGAGAGLQLGVYLTTRYAGVRNFATIYGLISSIQAGMTGVGPLIAAWIVDTTGSYHLFLWAGIPAIALSGLLVFGLGPYPDFSSDRR